MEPSVPVSACGFYRFLKRNRADYTLGMIHAVSRKLHTNRDAGFPATSYFLVADSFRFISAVVRERTVTSFLPDW
jgi:hypothetical protein